MLYYPHTEAVRSMGGELTVASVQCDLDCKYIASKLMVSISHFGSKTPCLKVNTIMCQLISLLASAYLSETRFYFGK